MRAPRVALWDAINRYASTCGADPSRYVYGNTPRQKAVVEIEKVIDAVVDALHEMTAAHQRADPHPPETCSNCTSARAALTKLEGK